MPRQPNQLRLARSFMQAFSARRPAPDETEIINPRVHGPAYELLRAYHSAEWRDSEGKTHVIVATSRLAEIEAAEKQWLAANPPAAKG